MIVIRFGKWCHKATSMYLYDRVFRNGCEWTPLCIKRFRYVGGRQNVEATPPCVVDVEVVRCKDCKHRDPENKKCDCARHEWLIGKVLPVADNWFCADGEKRQE